MMLKKGTIDANSYNLLLTRPKMGDLITPIKGNIKKGSSKRLESILTNSIDMDFYKYICQSSWWNFLWAIKSDKIPTTIAGFHSSSPPP